MSLWSQKIAVLSGIACCFLAAPRLFATFAQPEWERYQVILDREPFGRAPHPGSTPEGGDTMEVEPEPEPMGPSLSETIRLSMVTQFGGAPAAGFTEIPTGRSFYLFEGQSLEDFTLVSVDAIAGAAILRRGLQEERLLLGGGSAPDSATSMPPSRQSTAPAVRELPNPDTLSYAARQRLRAEEARQRAEAEAMQRQAEETLRQQQFEAERSSLELQRQLREYNLQLIRSGETPPLPIELTPEEVAQLAAEGFDVRLPPPAGGEAHGRGVAPEADDGL